MNTLNTAVYGVPLISGYTRNMDTSLVQTGFVSGWSRQRRTYVHNASEMNMTWRLPLDKAKSLIKWLQDQGSTDFFSCLTLVSIAGTDPSSSCELQPTLIRITNTIKEARIPKTNMCTVSITVETKEQDGYKLLAQEAANKTPSTYPSNLPLPQASGFVAEHGDRNTTAYTLNYAMDTDTLANWLAFAGFQGTAWFKHPMVSTNVLCGYEYLRYASGFSQTLDGPDRWIVSVTAETMPQSRDLDYYSPPPGGGCYYDDPFILYDSPDVTYDCIGSGPIPPQGEFTMPAGLLSLTDTGTGATTATATTTIKLFRDGSASCLPSSTPVWLRWHTAPTTQPNPAVSFNQVISFSTDSGLTWRNSSPAPGGYWISLKNQDVWVRYTKTASYDTTSILNFTMSFRENQLPTPGTFAASGQVRMTLITEVASDSEGPQFGMEFVDGYSYVHTPGDTIQEVAAGIIFRTVGSTQSYTSPKYYDDWYIPRSIGAGNNLYIEFTGTGNGNISPPTGIRIRMNAPVRCYTVRQANPDNSTGSVSWVGSYKIWNQAAGGSVVGDGTINLNSEVT